MYRHIFIATFKEEVSETVKNQELIDMQAMKKEISSIADLQVGFSLGWVGQKNQIVMTVDFLSKVDFDEYMKHPYHIDYIDKTGKEYFDCSTFVIAQFEF